jgi:hypothetical protein
MGIGTPTRIQGWAKIECAAFIRKVKTANGATVMQIAQKVKGSRVKIIHIGSAHTEEELQILLKLARKRLQANHRNCCRKNHPAV